MKTVVVAQNGLSNCRKKATNRDKTAASDVLNANDHAPGDECSRSEKGGI